MPRLAASGSPTTSTARCCSSRRRATSEPASHADNRMHDPMSTNHPRRIATTAEAVELLTHLGAVLDALLAIVEEETNLVRDSRLAEAARLEPKKTELAGQYYAAIERLKQNTDFLRSHAPDRLHALQDRHEIFRALLQINLTVLATAHAVSEGIIRGVANELTRKAAPQVYGVSGRQAAPAPTAARPVTLSRTL